jgi:hypothetical protein
MAKYRPTETLTDHTVVIDIIMNDSPIFYRHKVYRKGWAQNWSLGFIERETKDGRFRRAALKEGEEC